MSIALPAASAGTAPGTAPDSAPPAPPPDSPLTLRQEAFCRHYAATGNAAGAARDAGYAGGSARQTGHDLLERPDIAGRVRDIRAAWRAVERDEAQILLGRLEQAWDAAVEQGSASLMIRVVKLQAELSGLDRRSAHRRAGLWRLPGEGPGEEPGERPGEVSGEDALPRPADSEPGPPIGPLAEALRRGRHRTERALAAHRASRKALERRKDFDEADWLATAQRLHTTVEERRLPAGSRPPGGVQAGEASPPDAPDMTDPDISLHGALHPAADAPMPDSVPGSPTPTDPDISLHRAGLLPAQDGERAGEPAFDARAWREDHHAEMARIDAEGRPFTEREMQAYRAIVNRLAVESRRRRGDRLPLPAANPGPEERRAAEKEQDFLKTLARTRPPLEIRTAGAHLRDFEFLRPCR